MDLIREIDRSRTGRKPDDVPLGGVAVGLIRKQLGLQNIEVKLDLDESLPPIFAHHNRLEQVMFNLVTNARDAITRLEEKVGSL